MQHFFRLYRLSRSCHYDAIIRNSCGSSSLSVSLRQISCFYWFSSFRALPMCRTVSFFYFIFSRLFILFSRTKCYIANTSWLISHHHMYHTVNKYTQAYERDLHPGVNIWFYTRVDTRARCVVKNDQLAWDKKEISSGGMPVQ